MTKEQRAEKYVRTKFPALDIHPTYGELVPTWIKGAHMRGFSDAVELCAKLILKETKMGPGGCSVSSENIRREVERRGKELAAKIKALASEKGPKPSSEDLEPR